MIKETIISIVIVVVITLANVITQNYTKESVSKISGKLESMTSNIEIALNENSENSENVDNSNEEIMDKVREAKEEWKKRHDKLACYIEHDELEKVDVQIVNLESNVSTKDYEQAKANLKEGVFILQHIQDKYAFNLTNIF